MIYIITRKLINLNIVKIKPSYDNSVGHISQNKTVWTEYDAYTIQKPTSSSLKTPVE